MIDLFYSFNFETQIFLVTILLFTVIFHATYTSATAEKAPAFLTTLGIFGTFVGIAIGLMEFNTTDISASVPKLIEGIKTAVWASAAGIFAALTFKFRDIEAFYKRKRPTSRKSNIDDLIMALNAVELALRQQGNATAISSPSDAAMKPSPLTTPIAPKQWAVEIPPEYVQAALKELPVEMPRKPAAHKPEFESKQPDETLEQDPNIPKMQF